MNILGVSRSSERDGDPSPPTASSRRNGNPDQNKDPKAAARFAEANTAYEILGDADKRGQFDRGEIDAEGKAAFRRISGRGGNRVTRVSKEFDFGGP